MIKKTEEKHRQKLVVEEVSAPLTEKPALMQEVVEAPPTETQEPKKDPVEEQKLAIPTPPPSPITQPRFPIFWVIVPGLMILVLLVGGIYVYQKGVARESVVSEPTSTSYIEPENTASPEPKGVNKSKYSIDIQNGSGIKGEAGRVKALLENAGFSVKSAGNAKTYDYKETVIQAKEEVETEFLKELKITLEKSYLVKSKVDILADKESSEVVIIVGSSKP